MDDSPVATPPRRPQSLIASGLLIGTLLLLATCGTWFLITLNGLRKQVHAELAAIRQAGYPVTRDELYAWYPAVTPDENAAVLYLKAFEKFKNPTEEQKQHLPLVGEADLPSPGQPLPEESAIHIREYLAANRDCLSLLDQAVQRPGCRYLLESIPPDKHLPGDENPYVSKIKPCASLLLLNHLLPMDSPDQNFSGEAFRKSILMARSLDQEPLQLSQFVRVACLGSALDVLEWSISRRSFTNNTCQEIETLLASADSTKPLWRGFVGERCLYLDLFEQIQLPYYREKNQLGLLRVTGPLISALGTGASYTNISNATRTAQSDVERTIGPSDWITLSLPFWRSGVVTGFQSIARLRTARTALAVERYRSANNTLPKQVSDLVPGFLPVIPTDPFDGAPLRYRTRPKGYVVYSVGQDGKDDGGVNLEDNPTKDVTFTVAR